MIAQFFSSNFFNTQQSSARKIKTPPTTYVEHNVTPIPVGYYTYSIRVNKEENGNKFVSYNQCYIPSEDEFYDVIEWIEKASVVEIIIRRRNIDNAYNYIRNKEFTIERLDDVSDPLINQGEIYDFSIPDTAVEEGNYPQSIVVVNFWCSNGANTPSRVQGVLVDPSANGKVPGWGIIDLDDTCCWCAAYTVTGNGVFQNITSWSQSSPLTFKNPAELAVAIENDTQQIYGALNGITMTVYPGVVDSSGRYYTPSGLEVDSYSSVIYCYRKSSSADLFAIDPNGTHKNNTPPNRMVIQIATSQTVVPIMDKRYNQRVVITSQSLPQGTSYQITQSSKSPFLPNSATVRTVLAEIDLMAGVVWDMSKLEVFMRDNINAKQLAVGIQTNQLNFNANQSIKDINFSQDQFMTRNTMDMLQGGMSIGGGLINAAIGVGMGNPFALASAVQSGISGARQISGALDERGLRYDKDNYERAKVNDTADFAKAQLAETFELQMGNIRNQRATITPSPVNFNILSNAVMKGMQIYYEVMSTRAQNLADVMYSRYGYKVSVRTYTPDDFGYLKTKDALWDIGNKLGVIDDNSKLDIAKQLDMGVRFI